MRLLHTSDWHLGQKFLSHDRDLEQRAALDWLLDLIERERVDALIVAGDIFDTHNPPHSARSMYYEFLTRLYKKSCCPHVVIVGGNHDSPGHLDAPGTLLSTMNIHVVGAVTGNPDDQIIELKNPDGETELLVAAVPFLRHRDLRDSRAAESDADRTERTRRAIVEHYQTLAERIETLAPRVPVVTTGHLYARGAEGAEERANIYLSDTANIEAGQFSPVFDYVALGHIHRAQMVGQQAHIRYCGSLIPLSFSETEDAKEVVLVDFEEKTITDIRSVAVPSIRRLKQIKGTAAFVKQRLQKLSEDYAHQEPSWVDVFVTGEENAPDINGEIRTFAADLHLKIFKVRTERQTTSLDTIRGGTALDDLQPTEVFEQLCEARGIEKKKRRELSETFQELQEWMREREE